MDDHVPGDAWTDERLEAAFRALASHQAPAGLEARVLAAVDARPPRRWLALPGLALGGAAAIVLAAVLGTSLLGGPRGALTGTFAVRDGGDGTRILDTGEFSFAFPAAWSVADSGGIGGSGGSSIAVLGTLPVDPRCGSGHVDVNCVYEQRLEPGTLRAWVHSRSYRSGSILDEPTFEGSWEALTVDGMPARLDQPAISPDDFYRSDLALTFTVARPTGFGHVVTIELLAREPGIDAARAAMDRIIETFRYAEPPPTLPPDDAAGQDVARRVLAESDEVLRTSIGAGSGETPYSCQPEAPRVVAATGIGFDFSSALDGIHAARCSWTIQRSGDRFWLLTVQADWDVGGHANTATETIWVNAAGTVMGRRVEHLSATPSAPPESKPPVGEDGLPSVEEVLGLPVMTVEEALDAIAGAPGDAELAVLGWWPGNAPLTCPYVPAAESSPANPRCPDQFRFLTAEREPLIRVADISTSGGRPAGPSLTLLFRDGAAPPPTVLPAEGEVKPVPLLVLGHVADHRAVACPDDARDACESAFIVDLALSPGDPAFPARMDRLDAGGAVLEPAGSEDVATLLARRAADAPDGVEPEVVAFLRLAPEAVASVEPQLAEPGTGIAPTGVTWVVKLLVPYAGVAHIRTFAIRDAELAAYPEVLANGGISVWEVRSSGIFGTTWAEELAGGSPAP